MSGNGVFEAHNETKALPNGLNPIPPGHGGGCVENGPFGKYMKSLLYLKPFPVSIGYPYESCLAYQ